jgi:hypothetical protein
MLPTNFGSFGQVVSEENIQKLTDDGRQTPSDDKSPNLCSMPMIIDKILEESVN